MLKSYRALLEEIGGKVHFNDGEMTVDPSTMISMPFPNGKVKKLRASYYLMGAMLGRFKKAVIGFRVDVILDHGRLISILKDLKHLVHK